MLDDFYPSDEYETDGWNAGPRASKPADIVRDPDLTIAEKREILASWASDARAVIDTPSLRQLEDGTMVDIDAILSALKQLDAEPMAKVPSRSTPDQFLHRRTFASTMRSLAHSWRRDDDNNDNDPPPCPAGARVPRLPPSAAGDAALGAA